MARTIPANKRFRTYGLVRVDAVDGLKLHVKLFVVERMLHVVEDVLLLEHTIGELGIVMGDMTIVVALDGVARHHRAIEHDARLDIGVVDEIDARRQRRGEIDVALCEQSVNGRNYTLHDLLDIDFVFSGAKGEIVIAQASVNPAIGEELAHAARGLDEHPVTQLGAEELVEGLEVLDIPDGEQILLLGTSVNHALHLAQEGLARIEPRKIIMVGNPSRFLEHAHAHALLFKLTGIDDEADATSHDLGLDGLGKKVGGSRVKGMNLSSSHAVGRDDDDGNVGDGGIRLLFGKHVESGLARHVQIEQDGIDTVLSMLAHDLEGI